MNSILAYAEGVFDSFDERPFCAVDSLVLSTVAYTRVPEALGAARGWEGIRLVDLLRAEDYAWMYSLMWAPENAKRLLVGVASNPRYRDLRVCGYVDELDVEAEMQFSAMTFRVSPAWSYVAFRGTDNTLVGWKEDFNMAFKCPVPAQEAAARYVDEVARYLGGAIVTGGHSKGGNLAVYSAAKCGDGARGRIMRAYSHDGPGFMGSVLEDEDFRAVAGKVDKTLPQSSIVGLLLEDHENYRVVKSKSVSMWQHDPFNWEVVDGAFVELEHVTPDARHVDKTLQGWVARLDEEERGRLVDTIYDIINPNDDVTFEDWKADLSKTLPAILRSISQVDRETAEFLGRAFKELAVVSMRSVPAIFDARG